MLKSAGPADGAESGFSASKGRALGCFHPAAALSFPFRPFPFPHRLANPAAAGRPPAVGISGRRIGPDLLPPAGLQRRFLSLSRRKSYGALGSILGFGDAGLPFHPFWRRNFSEFSIYRRLCFRPSLLPHSAPSALSSPISIQPTRQPAQIPLAPKIILS